MSNKEIAHIIKLTARLLELHGENPFRIKSFKSAVFRIERHPVPLDGLSDDELLAIPGIGKSMALKIRSVITSGTLPEMDELLGKTPAGVTDMMIVKGIGPKKTGVLWRELGIESLHELLYACNENRLVVLKGFGEKTQQRIKESVEFTLANANSFHYAFADGIASEIATGFKNDIDNGTFSFSGDYRRKCNVVDKLDVVTSLSEDRLKDKLNDDSFVEWTKHPDNTLSCKHIDGLKILFHLSDENKMVENNFSITGSEKHIQHLSDIKYIDNVLANVKSEHELYKTYGMQYIEPELREGVGEIDAAAKNNIQDLISYTNLKGALHNHSTYSDGVNTVLEMAERCKDMGYEYFGICDHSKSAFYANGMQPERVIEQIDEIDVLNKQLSPFVIFKGIESDILHDGSLDYEPEILQLFDFVVASVHSGLNMDITKATDRIIAAVNNPFTTILGHPTGRLLLARKGYPLDHKAVIDACSENGVAIELNAHPYRLDLDWKWVRYATGRGVMISINPDAHSVDGLRDMYYGVCAGRKGWLTRQHTLNCLPKDELKQYFLRKKPVKQTH
jgi:DNA polymerase (family X)